MAPKFDVYAYVTYTIIAEIEAGTPHSSVDKVVVTRSSIRLALR